MSSLRKEVLSGYKSLHKISRVVFAGDKLALNAARTRINEEFKKNKHVDSVESIGEMLKFASEVENELRTTVVQAKQREPGVYELTLNKDTSLLENTVFQDNADIPKPRSPSKRCKK